MVSDFSCTNGSGGMGYGGKIKKSELVLYPTSFDIHDGELNNFTLFVGDSLGNLHLIK